MHDNEKNRLLAKLHELEDTYNIEIRYACLSGSRAYGCEAEDSDYDIRFFFVQPIEKYLSICTPRDTVNVMETDDDGYTYDIVGWDIRNTLHQAVKSNATFWDWMRSPAVLINKDNFAEKLSKVAAPYISEKKLLHSKYGMLRGIPKEKATVKEMLSAFRLIMQSEYIHRYLYAAPPVEFEDLLRYKCLPDISVETECRRLIKLKKEGKGKEVTEIPMDFIEKEDARIKGFLVEAEKKGQKAPDYEELDRFFQMQVGIK